jgi:hypothetical protein
MDNDTVLFWGVIIVIGFVIYLIFDVVRKLKGDAMNITERDWLEFLRK